MKFKHIKLLNFCGISSLETDLWDTTIISGKNRVGKTSIKNAIFWVLYDKLADGSAADGIRPHDGNGVDIDMIDIEVELTIENDGKTFLLKKTQKQKWVAKRGESEKVFQGNENLYEINGVPKKLRDYQEFIDGMVDMNTLIFGTNPHAFLSLDTKKRREKLLALDEGFSDADVIATDGRFKEVEADLEVATVEELLAREKKVVKAKNEEIKAIPTRVDELNNSKVNADVAELELLRNGILEEIKDVEDQIEKAKNIGKDHIASKILEAEFKKSDLEKAEYAKVQDKITALSQKINVENQTVYTYRKNVSDAEMTLNGIKRRIEDLKKELAELGDLYRKSEESQYTGSETCPTCGQKLPAESIEHAKSVFETHKQERMKSYADKGRVVKKSIEDLEAKIPEQEHIKEDNERLLKEAEKGVASLTKQIEKIKAEAVPAPKSKEYKAVLDEIASLKEQLKECATDDNIEGMKGKLYDLKKQLADAEHRIALAQNDIKIDERIEELKKEQVQLSQDVTDAERMIEILNDYNRAKIKMLTDRVNKFFDIISWKMFETQINGGTAEVCKAMVNGTSYDGLLNHGDKILAEIDICRAFQKAKGVSLPIVVDDTESVDEDRIPDIGTQIICLRRTDGELKITEV